MKTIIIQITCLLSLTMLFSCGKTTRHNEALKHFVAITTENNSAVLKVNNFISQLKKAAYLAQQSKGTKLEETSLDSLNQSFSKVNEKLDSAIMKISSVPELEGNLKFKEIILCQSKKIKQLLESFTPGVISSFRIGIDNLSDEQRESLEKHREQMKEIKAQQNELFKIVNDFKDNYQLTDEELTKYGL